MSITFAFGVLVGYLLACVDSLRENINAAAYNIYKFLFNLIKNKLSNKE